MIVELIHTIEMGGPSEGGALNPWEWYNGDGCDNGIMCRRNPFNGITHHRITIKIKQMRK